MMVS
jgi:hypothetical protein